MLVSYRRRVGTYSGDSGAWVRDSGSGDVVAMVFGECLSETGKILLLTPLPFDHIRQRFGLDLEVV